MNPFVITLLIDGAIVLLVILWKALEVRRLLNPNLIKAYIRMPNRRWAIFYCERTITKVGAQIRIKKHKTAYNINPSAIDYMGLLRMPTGHWNFNKADMIDFDDLQMKSTIASTDYYSQNNTVVWTGLLNTLKKEFFTPAMTVIFILGAIGLVGFLLYQQGISTQNAVKTVQEAIVPLPTPTTE